MYVCMYVGLEATIDASSRPIELTSVDTAQFCLCKNPTNMQIGLPRFRVKTQDLSRPFFFFCNIFFY